MSAPRPIRSILEARGSTPLLELRRIAEPLKGPNGHVRIFAKCEFISPSQSHKDRSAAEVLRAAEAEGAVHPGCTIIEATSGNFGIALAQLCAVKGYQLLAVMPESMSLERRETLKLLGAKVELTPAKEHLAGAVRRVQELSAEQPSSFIPSQFENENAAKAYGALADELFEQAKAANVSIDAFVCAVGSGAVLAGTGRALKARSPQTHVIAVEPKEPGPHRLHGAGSNFTPAVYAAFAPDQVHRLASEDAWTMQRRLAREEGVLVGVTSGGNVAAAIAYGHRHPGKNVFTLLCDTGERYFSVAPEWETRP